MRWNGGPPAGGANLSRIAQTLWEHGDLSRANLAKQTGLARSTVSTLVQRLIDLGLVAEAKRAPSSGGRRAILLRLVDRRAAVVGVEMGASHLTVLVTDLGGTPLARRTEAFPVQEDPAGTLDRIESMVGESLQAGNVDLDSVVGLGIGVPCPVDPHLPNVLSRRILPAWGGVAIRDELQGRFGVPVRVDNDANLGAVAEHRWGAGRGVDHLAYVKLATGIGAGLLIDGRTFAGASGVAGEIGHCSVQAGGPRCRCGLPGCLEAVAGGPALLESVKAKGGVKGLPSEQTTVAAVARAAVEGDQVAASAVATAGDFVGIALATLVNTLNPARVVLGGDLAMAGDVLIRPMRSALESRALAASVARTDLVVGSLREDAVALGAVALILESVLADPTLLESTQPLAAPRGLAALRRSHA